MATTITRYVNPHSSGGDGTTAALAGANAAYASLQAAIAAEASARPNLVTNDELLEILCATEGNADTTPVVVTGFTTDATRYVHIKGDPNQAGGRHEGRWSDSHYRLVTTSGGSYTLSVAENYTRVEGIQAHYNNNNFLTAFNIADGQPIGGVRFIDCIGRTGGANNAGSFFHGSIGSNLPAPNYCINCVAFGPSGGSHFYLRSGDGGSDTPTYLLNCTAYGGASGFRARGARCHMFNCVSVGSTEAVTETGPFLGSHFAFDVGTDPLTDGVDISAFSDAQIFIDAANGDLHLAVGSPLIGVGIDLSSDFTTDIDGDTRTVPWSIGVDQIVSGGGEVDASGDLGVPASTLGGTASVTRGASGALIVPSAGLAASVTVQRSASGALQTPSATLEASAGVITLIQGAIGLPAVALAASSAVARSAAGALSLGPVALAGTGAVSRSVAGGITVGLPTVASSVDSSRSAAGALALPALELDAAAARTVSVAGAVTLPPVGLAGVLAVARFASGDLALAIPVLAGTAAGEQLVASAAIVAPLPVLAAESMIQRTAGGLLTLSAPVLDGDAVRTVQVEGLLLLSPADLSSAAAVARLASGALTAPALVLQAAAVVGPLHPLVLTTATVRALTPRRTVTAVTPNRGVRSLTPRRTVAAL